MEVYLDKRSVRQIQLSAADAIDEGDTETLKEDILESFPEEMLEGIEQRLGGMEFMEMLGDVLEEWGGDHVEELLDLLETQLGDYGIDLHVARVEDDENDSEDNDDDESIDDDDESIDDDDEGTGDDGDDVSDTSSYTEDGGDDF